MQLRTTKPIRCNFISEKKRINYNYTCKLHVYLCLNDLWGRSFNRPVGFCGRGDNSDQKEQDGAISRATYKQLAFKDNSRVELPGDAKRRMIQRTDAFHYGREVRSHSMDITRCHGSRMVMVAVKPHPPAVTRFKIKFSLSCFNLVQTHLPKNFNSL